MNKYPFTESFLLSTLSKAFAPLKVASPNANIIAHRNNLSQQQQQQQQHFTTSNRRHHALASFSFWATLAILCITALSSTTSVTDAAPAKKGVAPKNIVQSMGFTVSEVSPLPLQLQLEAAVAGTQKLAYLPTSGPAMDFYYLNYRPAYRAGESKIDFWMLTPEGSKAPKTGSLELYDEFGKIRIATLV
ncbi:hypothetical protein BGZ94_005145, partial [Podila epigama]